MISKKIERTRSVISIKIFFVNHFLNISLSISLFPLSISFSLLHSLPFFLSFFLFLSLSHTLSLFPFVCPSLSFIYLSHTLTHSLSLSLSLSHAHPLLICKIGNNSREERVSSVFRPSLCSPTMSLEEFGDQQKVEAEERSRIEQSQESAVVKR